MNLFTYLGISKEAFYRDYVDTDLVVVNEHDEFPLNIYNYSRTCVQENRWDSVTSKCRGIIAHRKTGEVIARPFEKFHNFGSPQATLDIDGAALLLAQDPVVWEKVDGFMCTGYTWAGRNYVASKGSFHSTHAKWATTRV